MDQAPNGVTGTGLLSPEFQELKFVPLPGEPYETERPLDCSEHDEDEWEEFPNSRIDMHQGEAAGAVVFPCPCNNCELSFRGLDRLQAHIKDDHDHTSRSKLTEPFHYWECTKPDCGQRFVQLTGLEIHIQEIHMEKIKELKKRIKYVPVEQVCNICNRKVHSIHALKLHMRDHRDNLDLEKKEKYGVIACRTCGKESTSGSALRTDHLIEVDSGLGYECPRWGENQGDIGLEEIEEESTSESEFQVESEPRIDVDSTSKTILPLDGFHCKLCPLKFHSQRRLNAHRKMKNAHPQLKIKLKKLPRETVETGRIFTLKLGSNAQPWYICVRCGRASKSSEVAIIHQRVHGEVSKIPKNRCVASEGYNQSSSWPFLKRSIHVDRVDPVEVIVKVEPTEGDSSIFHTECALKFDVDMEYPECELNTPEHLLPFHLPPASYQRQFEGINEDFTLPDDHDSFRIALAERLNSVEDTISRVIGVVREDDEVVDVVEEEVEDWEREFMSVITVAGKSFYLCKVCSTGFRLKAELQEHVLHNTGTHTTHVTIKPEFSPDEEEQPIPIGSFEMELDAGLLDEQTECDPLATTTYQNEEVVDPTSWPQSPPSSVLTNPGPEDEEN